MRVQNDLLLDQLKKITADNEAQKLQPVYEKARKLASQGYDDEQIIELLFIDHGCDEATSKVVLADIDDDTGNKCHGISHPPVAANDLSDIIVKTIGSVNPDDIIREMGTSYGCGKIMAKAVADELGLDVLIKHYQKTGSISTLNTILTAMQPYIDNAIINSNLATDDDEILKTALNDYNGHKSLFGIWPPFEIKKANIEQSIEKEILGTVYENKRYVYCSRYKTEIDSGYFCKNGCSFYSGSCSNKNAIKCRFKD